MTPGNKYRVKAAELRAKAAQETVTRARDELERLARGYILLAEQADRNARTDVVYEPPPDSPATQQSVVQQQQQQQVQPKKDDDK